MALDESARIHRLYVQVPALRLYFSLSIQIFDTGAWAVTFFSSSSVQPFVYWGDRRTTLFEVLNVVIGWLERPPTRQAMA